MSNRAKLQPRYSGDASRPFWRRIGRLPDNAEHWNICALGVKLQNLEGYVLRRLEKAARASHPSPRSPE